MNNDHDRAISHKELISNKEFVGAIFVIQVTVEVPKDEEKLEEKETRSDHVNMG